MHSTYYLQEIYRSLPHQFADPLGNLLFWLVVLALALAVLWSMQRGFRKRPRNFDVADERSDVPNRSAVRKNGKPKRIDPVAGIRYRTDWDGGNGGTTTSPGNTVRKT